MTDDQSRLADLASEIRQLPTSEDALYRLRRFSDRLADIDVPGVLNQHDDVILLLYKSVAKNLLDRVSSEGPLDRESLADAVTQLLGSFALAPLFVHNDRAKDSWYARMHRYAAAYRDLASPATTQTVNVQGIEFLVVNNGRSQRKRSFGAQQLAMDPTLGMQPSLDQVLTDKRLRKQILSWYKVKVGRALRHHSNGSGSSLCFVGRATEEHFPSGAFTLMNPLHEFFPASTQLTYQRDGGVELANADFPPPKSGGFTVLIGDATDSGGSFGFAAGDLREQYGQEVKTACAIYDFDAGAGEFLSTQGIELHSYLHRSEIADSLLEAYLLATSPLSLDNKRSRAYTQRGMSPEFSPSQRTEVSHPLHEDSSGDSRSEVRSLREHGDAIVDELVSELQMVEFRDPLHALIRDLETSSIPGLRGVALAIWESSENPTHLSVHPLIDQSTLAEEQLETTQERLNALRTELNRDLRAQPIPRSCDLALIDTEGEDIALAIDQFRQRLESRQYALSLLAPGNLDDERLALLTVATAA